MRHVSTLRPTLSFRGSSLTKAHFVEHAQHARTSLRSARDYIRWTTSMMKEAGCAFGQGASDAYSDAAGLICQTLRLSPNDERTEHLIDARVTAPEADKLLANIKRRVINREPTAYITGEAILGKYTFKSTPVAIIPRSLIAEVLEREDSEEMEGNSLSLVSILKKQRPEVQTVLDLCCGGGSLAIIAAHTFPRAKIGATKHDTSSFLVRQVASDNSKEALQLAADNVRDYGLANRITLLQGDLFAAIPELRFDLILSNPPYVTENATAELPPEFLHEPRAAFAGGKDGLDVVRRILDTGRAHLKPGGGFLIESGAARRADVEKEFGRNFEFTWLPTSVGIEDVYFVRERDVQKKPTGNVQKTNPKRRSQATLK